MITVLVPVLNRPQNVVPLVDSFLTKSNETSCLLFVVQADDVAQISALRLSAGFAGRINFHVVDPPVTRWSQKLNAAHRYLNYDTESFDLLGNGWYLLGADDLKFHSGWDDNDQLKALQSDETIGVIGTNDLGNPAVIAGKHSTHPLMRVSYVEEQGIEEARGIIAPECYHHNWVDNEIVGLALKRGAYAHCHASVIEHLHPAWKKGKMDATYALGNTRYLADQRLFAMRRETYGWPQWTE